MIRTGVYVWAVLALVIIAVPRAAMGSPLHPGSLAFIVTVLWGGPVVVACAVVYASLLASLWRWGRRAIDGR